jgi:hypothetical protein
MKETVEWYSTIYDHDGDLSVTIFVKGDYASVTTKKRLEVGAPRSDIKGLFAEYYPEGYKLKEIDSHYYEEPIGGANYIVLKREFKVEAMPENVPNEVSARVIKIPKV